MSLTSETMDEHATMWNDEASAPDALIEPDPGMVTTCVVVLIAEGDLCVDPLELF